MQGVRSWVSVRRVRRRLPRFREGARRDGWDRPLARTDRREEAGRHVPDLADFGPP
ncbi:hypothetical protein GCM10017776_46460 [Streptomyces griseoluteus]|nr:hypothetical protein GCM10017776_46460 [Streptomyces griseoluteus]